MATVTQPVAKEQVSTTGSKRDFRQEVTDNIIDMLETGTAPWQKPWEPTAGAFGMPMNPTTEKAYRGGNAIHLMATGLRKGYDDPRWMTYKQAISRGSAVSRSRCARIRLLFLNAMDGISPHSFDFSEQQMSWLERQLNDARVTGLRSLVFTHLYPSELETQGRRFSRAIRQGGVELVEMGHTHYNELANDGGTIYATTRSTGQAEEGPPGFSITVIDDDVIGWKFKERERWPLAMITSPADEKLITRPASPHHIVRGEISVCARV